MIFALVAVVLAYQCCMIALQPPPTAKDWAGVVSRLCALILCVCVEQLQLVTPSEEAAVRRTAAEVVRSFTTGRGGD